MVSRVEISRVPRKTLADQWTWEGCLAVAELLPKKILGVQDSRCGSYCCGFRPSVGGIEADAIDFAAYSRDAEHLFANEAADEISLVRGADDRVRIGDRRDSLGL